MDVKPTVVEAIGNTPLIRLRRASELTGCEIYGKAEFLNPGQSVKDRPARQMILAAEHAGTLKPGGLIVEGTAGNTGIGLALVASARGYRTIIVIPDTQSQEKKDALRLAGATLIEVPVKPRCPTAAGESRWPELECSVDGVSHPSAQVEPGTVASRVQNSRIIFCGTKSERPA